MSAYRDIDPGTTNAFAQHVAIAAALLDQFSEIPTRMGGARPEEIQDLAQEARTVWDNLWDQLGQARQIAKGLGHDVAAYDAARVAAGDIWLRAVEVSFGPWERTAGGQRRTVTWRSAPLEPARAAIQALTTLMPGAVALQAPPQDIELRTSYKRITEWGPLAIVLLVVVYIVLRLVL